MQKHKNLTIFVSADITWNSPAFPRFFTFYFISGLSKLEHGLLEKKPKKKQPMYRQRHCETKH